MNEQQPVGPEVDATPRGLPARTKLRGSTVELEPLHRRHVPELWQAMQGADDSWAYLGYGPFASESALARFVEDFATTHDPVVWAVRPTATGVATGWLALLDIQPRNAVIELGHIWFGPRMRRTRAATEAMFMLLRLAADDLGYRRLCWKCNALNGPSRRAARAAGLRLRGYAAGASGGERPAPRHRLFQHPRTTSGRAVALRCRLGSIRRISVRTEPLCGVWGRYGGRDGGRLFGI